MQIHPWQWSVQFIAREYRLAAKFVRSSKNHKVALALTLLIPTAAFTAVSSQSSANNTAKVSVQRVNLGLEQCATLPEACTTTASAQWQTGNLNSNNSSYYEGQSVPYRAAFTDLTVGQIYKLTIGWDSTKGGLRAHDYLTSFDRSISSAVPCDTTLCGSEPVATIGIPLDAALGSVPQIPGMFSAYGATFTPNGTTIPSGSIGNLCPTYPCTIAANPTAYTLTGDPLDDSENEVSVYFTASNAIAVIAWGGHIASSADWGPNSSASSINGSPYHMRLNAFACQNDNCSSGNLDRSMQAAAAPVVTTLPPATTLPPVTTLPPATTLPPETTIFIAVTVPVTTTPSAVVPDTFADPDLLVQFPDIGDPSEPDFLVQFPEELPSTGAWFNLVFIIQLMILLIASGFLFLSGVIVQHRFVVRR